MMVHMGMKCYSFIPSLIRSLTNMPQIFSDTICQALGIYNGREMASACPFGGEI